MPPHPCVPLTAIVPSIIAALCPGIAAVNAQDGAGGTRTVCRSMAELPRVATPGTIIDFLDERWVEDTHCLTRKVTQAELLPEPALRHKNANCPLNAAGTVLRRDDGTLAFYYQTVPRAKPYSLPPNTPDSVKEKWRQYKGTYYTYFLHYATSTDGVHWDLPNLGLRRSYPVTKSGESVHVETPDGMVMKRLEDKDNNILLGPNEEDANGRRLTGASGVAGGFCIIDAKRTPHPAARARYTALYQNGGLCLAMSEDGFRWTAYPENPIRVGQSSDTYNTVMYDPRWQEYAMFCRPRWARGGPDPRAVTRIASRDLIHWGPERIILQTDDRDAPAHGRRRPVSATDESVFTRGRELQFYGFTSAVYQNLTLGFALVFDTYASASWIELTHSYDGVDWRREPRRTPFIVPVPGSWNAGGVYFVASGSPVEVGDDLLVYVTGMNTAHGWRIVSQEDQGKLRWIAAARLRKGRFVGYATGADRAFERPDTPKKQIPPYWKDRGMLMTRPFRLDCEELSLNAKVDEGGSISVEIRDGTDVTTGTSPQPTLKAFGRDAAVPIGPTDTLKAPVTFRDATVASLRGRSIRLLMRLEKATVYGLAFE